MVPHVLVDAQDRGSRPSRFAYVEMHSDERSQTAIAVLRRAVAHFARLGVEVERVLSDNGSAYRSHAWRDACTELGIKPKGTRPYRQLSPA